MCPRPPGITNATGTLMDAWFHRADDRGGKMGLTAAIEMELLRTARAR